MINNITKAVPEGDVLSGGAAIHSGVHDNPSADSDLRTVNQPGWSNQCFDFACVQGVKKNVLPCNKDFTKKTVILQINLFYKIKILVYSSGAIGQST